MRSQHSVRHIQRRPPCPPTPDEDRQKLPGGKPTGPQSPKPLPRAIRGSPGVNRKAARCRSTETRRAGHPKRWPAPQYSPIPQWELSGGGEGFGFPERPSFAKQMERSALSTGKPNPQPEPTPPSPPTCPGKSSRPPRNLPEQAECSLSGSPDPPPRRDEPARS